MIQFYSVEIERIVNRELEKISKKFGVDPAIVKKQLAEKWGK
jgi:hypothetical protein